MKSRRCLVLIVLALACLFSLSAGSREGFDFHLDGGVSFVRGSQLAPFGGVSLGIHGNVYGMEGFAIGSVMTQPGGSATGMNATMEFSTEMGFRFLWRLFSTEATISRVLVDVGYFTQWLELPNQPNVIHRMCNGIMVRSGIRTVVWTGYLYQIELGVAYQKAVLPAFSEYDGLVISLSLF
ncbi:MAG: hypothetical protein SO135_07520 [Sphaerochaetaceae bacterium]|jgi:hypothetical protein|nr:hypothetical protein [Sphaerochaetaceae bacterium]